MSRTIRNSVLFAACVISLVEVRSEEDSNGRRRSESASVASADDWPHLRGPDMNARASGADLVDSWGEQGPPVLWTRELGQGYSAMTVVDGRVYTQYQTLGGQYLICLDGRSGETIWQHRYSWPYQPAGMYPGPRATPTIADGRVYFAAPSGAVGCVMAESGQPVWSVKRP